MPVHLWSKVAIAIQSALSASQVISAITKANPGVATYVGADPSNGDYVKVLAVGMHQVNERVFRVANVNGAGNTFELEGENTTDYDTFVSGSFEIVTFGTTLATVTALQSSGGDFEFEDTSTIHTDQSTQVPTRATPIVYTFEHLWDPADTGLLALKAASDAKTQRCVRFTFASGAKVVFTGYIGAKLVPGGAARTKVSTSTVITMNGSPTPYSS